MQSHKADSSITQASQDARTWNPLRLLTFYRVILASLLAILFFGLRDETSLGLSYPVVYGYTVLAYLAFSVLAGFSTRLRVPGYEFQAITQVLVDIGAITLLMFASGGPASGLGILLIIAVATGSILLSSHIAFAFAACATLAVIGEHFYSNWLTQNPAGSDFTQAGLLGLTFFVTAAVTALLVQRIRESEALAYSRGIDVANLAKLNAHIVQRLQAGIIVTDHNDNIRLINDTARKLLHVTDSHDGQSLAALSEPLYRQLLDWKDAPDNEPTLLLQGSDSDSVLPHFTRLGSADSSGALIFIEDTATIIRQTQQIKLASLGRLTASKAHEIRNPLGAISHAAQLLNEENTLADADQRLMTIIHDNTRRVNAIVENILQLSRPERSIPQTIRLADWLDKFVDEFVQSGTCKREEISCSMTDKDTEIRIDPGLLHQVVWNLCQNAVQHGRPDENVKLALATGLSTHIDAPTLDIIDNGPGIPADMADKIFEPFFTTRTSGTGLGLYIARDICESNNMRLEYIQKPGQGSCFRITFPSARHLPVTALA